MRDSSSLPESWDNYTSSFLGSSGNRPQLKSQELVEILIEEARRRKGRKNGATALQAKGKGGKAGTGTDKECYNCHKKGHLAKDCWAKGGGKEGQGPKGRKGKNRSNQASAEQTKTLNDICYMAGNDAEVKPHDWFIDSGTTSHICTIRDTFVDFYPEKSSVKGIGPSATCLGRGTVIVNCRVEGKTLRHCLMNTLYIPDAPNCLMSVKQLGMSGGWATFYADHCVVKEKSGKVIATGYGSHMLYQLGQERTNYAAPTKQIWEQWHRKFGHIATQLLVHLDRENLVDGMAVDPASNPLHSCTTCIQAKQT